ncbi:aconitate hydratase [Methylacidimicrobium sp. B4]|uniref:aconitate hydratase n=1 Tax=Methylacidimicrobium sp. B4 TaxID=2796139 RepID=UPI001A8D2DC5|nr:aconitate hydratase [Methylacidimicrobium sp. B4]QSR85102.1 aconitate hydratase [Methylacidimicrobium sp. B4]
MKAKLVNAEWRRSLAVPGAGEFFFFSLPALEEAGLGPVRRLPISLRIFLESLARFCGTAGVDERDVEALARWEAKNPARREIPLRVARILLQDFTGVPLLVDLAAMRSALARIGRVVSGVEPEIPVDLVIDHSVQVDLFGRSDALAKNLGWEFARNRDRYAFLKWGEGAFRKLRIVPPGIGICHQVNLEYLAKGVFVQEGREGRVLYPDTVLGTDSHTTMINGLGVVGWGVGGIEAEAAMLGEPYYLLTPDVVGVHLTGALAPGVTATDLVLRITEKLRQVGVVNKIVEFFGPGASSLRVPDRATLSNMAPEYGATMGYFPFDRESLAYLRRSGRPRDLLELVERYYLSQGMLQIPQEVGEVDYTEIVELPLEEVEPAVAGPRRPQDRIGLKSLKGAFQQWLTLPVDRGGYGKSPEDLAARTHVQPQAAGRARPPDPNGPEPGSPSESELRDLRPTPDPIEVVSNGFPEEIGHGSVVIAAITSCTNTSNPSVMLAAGLLAKKAVERGLTVPPHVKTSLAPGSRVVSDYLARAGLQDSLDRLGFQVVGYGCTTCIGNSGPLSAPLEEAIGSHRLIVAAVLSGNRNFEARIHAAVRANFLMSPPLVVAFALAGRVDWDPESDPLGRDENGRPVFLRDIWPSGEEVSDLLDLANDPDAFGRLYRNFAELNPQWQEIEAPGGAIYAWDANNTYIQEPPFLEGFSLEAPARRPCVSARALCVLGDSVTTDHISPAGAIKADGPAGRYLKELGVGREEFNSYGSRRGNDRVMVRGTFANVRLRNQLVPGVEGGVTRHLPDGAVMSIYDAAMQYRQEGVPLLVLAGREYGTGSSRDWAAKGSALLGVRAVVAESFERIHRGNLVGMGVLPCTFGGGVRLSDLSLDGSETFEIPGFEQDLGSGQELSLRICRPGGETREVPILCRIDTPAEADYFRHGGILPYVLRRILAREGKVG